MLRLSKSRLSIIVGATALVCGDIWTADAFDGPALEAQCQNMAASKYDAGNKGVTVPWDKISGPNAEEVCRKALDIFPDRLALKLRLARALIVNDKPLEGAVILFEAVANGDSVAMALLAEIFRDGIKVPVDKKVAVAWLTHAAQQGNDVAKSDLGEMYYFGEGVEKSAKTAAEWLNKAGENRTSSGSALLGHLYFNGQGVPRDDVRAVTLFKTAAPDNCVARFGLAVARDGNRGGLDHGDMRKAVAQTNLAAAYYWVAKDPKCPDHLRKLAQTRADEIAYEGSSYYARRGSSRSGSSNSGTASFGDAVQQALEFGVRTMAAIREGQKSGLITPEMEDVVGQIGQNLARAEAKAKQEQEQNCLNQGMRGRAVGGGCAR